LEKALNVNNNTNSPPHFPLSLKEKEGEVREKNIMSKFLFNGV
jgi:hypothetical protein